MADKILSVKNITKRFQGITALNNVSLDFFPGEVHALLGENGAGKSTLIKIIAGALIPDEGTLEFSDGMAHPFMTPILAKHHGIDVIYQEFNLVGCLSVAENICFGEEKGRFVDYRHMKRVAEEAFRLFEVDVDPNMAVYELPSSKQQIVEISRAIFRKTRILIMDEPSAPLSVAEVEKMFRVIRKLKAEGAAIIYISHRMDELFEISDKVTVMRDGKKIITLNTAETNRRELVNFEVGRELNETFPVRTHIPDQVMLKVDHLTGNGDEDISLEIKKGEIVGLAGLVGAGRTELARLLFGADRQESGRIFLEGREIKVSSPGQALKIGIGMIPEDRKQHGCLLTRSIKSNISLSILPRISVAGFIDGKKEQAITEGFAKKLSIKTPDLEQPVSQLSGGNQQKVAVAKTLAAECKVLIFDEPTRGIDVGAKQEIYKLISRLAEEGSAILLITSEMEELIGLCDRLIVLHEGRISGELARREFDQARILELSSGMA